MGLRGPGVGWPPQLRDLMWIEQLPLVAGGPWGSCLVPQSLFSHLSCGCDDCTCATYRSGGCGDRASEGTAQPRPAPHTARAQ